MALTNITMENLPFSMGFQQNPHGLYRPGPAGGRRELVFNQESEGYKNG